MKIFFVVVWAMVRTAMAAYLLGVAIVPMAILSACASVQADDRVAIDKAAWTPDNPAYRSFYGWEDRDGTWRLGMTKSASGTDVAYHVFRGDGTAPFKGTAFILHGYLEHSALRVPMAAELIRAGWTAVGVDLPGHGLSGGKRADIDDLNQYAEALESVLDAENWDAPLRVIAHSAGGATTLLVCARRGNPFEFGVLEAPLVRTFLWEPTVAAERLLGGAISTVPRRDGGISRDQPFYRLLKSDPLYEHKVPVHWFDAVVRYFEETKAWSAIPGRFLVIQGTKDSVVDAAYNIPFLRGILPDAEFAQIAGGRHHLLMDAGPSGQEARRLVRSRW